MFRKKKRDYGNYHRSSHATTYEQIAYCLGSSPQHVYEIAHGKYLRDFDDKVIEQYLIDAGIIKREVEYEV